MKEMEKKLREMEINASKTANMAKKLVDRVKDRARNRLIKALRGILAVEMAVCYKDWVLGYSGFKAIPTLKHEAKPDSNSNPDTRIKRNA